MEVPISYQTSISSNIVLFCRFLRQKGFSIGVTDSREALLALTYIDMDNEDDFKQALKSTLAKSKYQLRKFDEYYWEFWDQLSRSADSKIKQKPEKKRKPVKSKQEQFEALKSWLNLIPAEEEKEVAASSDINVLAKKEFGMLDEDELRLAMQLLKKMAKKLTHQQSRLLKKSKKHKKLNIRRTIRRGMRRGCAIDQLQFSERKQRRLRLVLLCDVSRSMELYSKFFVHLIYAFQSQYDKIETFVFSTALHRVSEILDNHDFISAFDIISDRVPQWSGGTTIGHCLQDFDKRFGYSMLDRRTVVMILSDGWDTGDPELMRQTMKSIHKKARKVIWLNPLAGHADFSPDVIGMKAALPYIDVLAPAHNLDSLQKVLHLLRKKHHRLILL